MRAFRLQIVKVLSLFLASVLVEAAGGFAPVFSYSPDFFEQQIDLAGLERYEFDFRIASLEQARGVAERRHKAIGALIDEYARRLSVVSERAVIRELQSKDDRFNLGLAQAGSAIASREKDMRAEYDRLLVLGEASDRSLTRFDEQVRSAREMSESLDARRAAYERLLAQARQEQLGSERSYEAYRARREELRAKLGVQSSIALSWPVEPALGISAHFHDESYKARFGFEHNAIDIPVVQGSNVLAASDGIVIQSVDNGLGYNYVTIAHSGDMLTTYGHVSDIFVSEGEKVRAGDVIALSGGIPGTPGAGSRTTGAHLHFEVRIDDEFVDPLGYLPPQ